MGWGWREVFRTVRDLAERPHSDVEIDADITVDGEHLHWHTPAKPPSRARNANTEDESH